LRSLFRQPFRSYFIAVYLSGVKVWFGKREQVVATLQAVADRLAMRFDILLATTLPTEV
jgi:hypothetical protein